MLPSRYKGYKGMSKSTPHWDTTLDIFLTEEGVWEAGKAEAVTRRVVAWQFAPKIGSGANLVLLAMNPE